MAWLKRLTAWIFRLLNSVSECVIEPSMHYQVMQTSSCFPSLHWIHTECNTDLLSANTWQNPEQMLYENNMESFVQHEAVLTCLPQLVVDRPVTKC